MLCPFCGHAQAKADRCTDCDGQFDMLSRRATQIRMGPWFIRDKANPFRPGVSYPVLVEMIEQGHVKPTTVLRGPTTRQFWSIARNVPGVSYLVGYCHDCHKHVSRTDRKCSDCGAAFHSVKLRNELGLQFTSRRAAEAAQRALNRELGVTPDEASDALDGPAGDTADEGLRSNGAPGHAADQAPLDDAGASAGSGDADEAAGLSAGDVEADEPSAAPRLTAVPSDDLISDVLGNDLSLGRAEPTGAVNPTSRGRKHARKPHTPEPATDHEASSQEVPEMSADAVGAGSEVSTLPAALPPRRPMDWRVWLLVGLNALVALVILLYVVMGAMG